jgi:hypothetical protein
MARTIRWAGWCRAGRRRIPGSVSDRPSSNSCPCGRLFRPICHRTEERHGGNADHRQVNVDASISPQVLCPIETRHIETPAVIPSPIRPFLTFGGEEEPLKLSRIRPTRPKPVEVDLFLHAVSDARIRARFAPRELRIGKRVGWQIAIGNPFDAFGQKHSVGFDELLHRFPRAFERDEQADRQRSVVQVSYQFA